ncbi:MAG: anaerobic glycerol-3-phosphate dehydrogenase subunit C [Pirellulales bacterium]
MDPERQRIGEDLRGLVAGDVFCDPLHTQLYATDASNYELRPLGIVRPRTTADVVATVDYARQNRLPIHARGAGSGLAGESLGRGLVIDFSRYMRRVLSVGGDQVRVQAGVVHGDLNRMLARSGRTFGPDPALTNVTTIGGVVSVDAGGSHWLKYGSTRPHVRAMKVVLADGQVLEVARHPVAADPRREEPARLREIITATAELIERHGDVIEQFRPQSLVNRSGYALDRALIDGEIDLAKLIVGSEGTLALVSEITLATQPLPAMRGAVLVVFDSLDKAARAVLEIVPLEPSACDLMDRRHLSIARETDVRYELLIPGAAEAVLLVEFFADGAESLREKLRQVVQLAQHETGLAAGSHIAHDADENELFWQLAQRFVPTLHRLKGSTRPVPCVEDIAIPPAALPVFLRHLQDTLKRQQITAAVFGHAGHGQLHIRPFLDLANPEHIQKMETLASELYEKVWLLRGTVSGEHGDGLSRTPFLSRQYGPLVNVFRELKRVFDPDGILNPGKVVPTAGARMTHDLRNVVYTAPASTNGAAANGEKPPQAVELQLHWQPEEMAAAARECNGCGACRSNAEGTRMCPIFRYAPREEASPRAKANLARAVLTGQLPFDQLVQDDAKAVADLCVHCHMCRLECPANVDIPKLMLEAKANYVQTNGLTIQDWLLARLDRISSWGSRTPGLSNWSMSNRQMRWILSKVLGLALGRKLPKFSPRTFLRMAASRGWNRPVKDTTEKVLFFADTFVNHFDAELGEAVVKVLKHNKVGVYVPTEQRHAGMAMITQGVLEPARRIAQRNVNFLAEAVRQGYTIISTEPSAVLALTHEYPILLDRDDDSLLVAQHTFEACHYLWKRHQHGALKLDFDPLNLRLAYHVPCHLKALEIGTPAENLLRLIPELRLTKLEKGCSGMAGTYGLRQKNYRSSLRVGLPLMTTLRDGPYQAGTTECAACKIQMEQGTTKPTIHPMKFLAAAYGLSPQILESLSRNGANGVGQ